VSLKRITFEANGLRFHALTVGEGPLALMLHGFPDSPHTFHARARPGGRGVPSWP
jgi:hypothetical protein